MGQITFDFGSANKAKQMGKQWALGQGLLGYF